MIRILPGKSVSDWQRWILDTLEYQPDKQLSLLALMRAAHLQSRSAKHPFNDALSLLVEEKRVMWQSVPGQPIRIVIPE